MDVAHGVLTSLGRVLLNKPIFTEEDAEQIVRIHFPDTGERLTGLLCEWVDSCSKCVKHNMEISPIRDSSYTIPQYAEAYSTIHFAGGRSPFEISEQELSVNFHTMNADIDLMMQRLHIGLQEILQEVTDRSFIFTACNEVTVSIQHETEINRQCLHMAFWGYWYNWKFNEYNTIRASGKSIGLAPLKASFCPVAMGPWADIPPTDDIALIMWHFFRKTEEMKLGRVGINGVQHIYQRIGNFPYYKPISDGGEGIANVKQLLIYLCDQCSEIQQCIRRQNKTAVIDCVTTNIESVFNNRQFPDVNIVRDTVCIYGNTEQNHVSVINYTEQHIRVGGCVKQDCTSMECVDPLHRVCLFCDEVCGNVSKVTKDRKIETPVDNGKRYLQQVLNFPDFQKQDGHLYEIFETSILSPIESIHLLSQTIPNNNGSKVVSATNLLGKNFETQTNCLNFKRGGVQKAANRGNSRNRNVLAINCELNVNRFCMLWEETNLPNDDWIKTLNQCWYYDNNSNLQFFQDATTHHQEVAFVARFNDRFKVNVYENSKDLFRFAPVNVPSFVKRNKFGKSVYCCQNVDSPEEMHASKNEFNVPCFRPEDDNEESAELYRKQIKNLNNTVYDIFSNPFLECFKRVFANQGFLTKHDAEDENKDVKVSYAFVITSIMGLCMHEMESWWNHAFWFFGASGVGKSSILLPLKDMFENHTFNLDISAAGASRFSTQQVLKEQNMFILMDEVVPFEGDYNKQIKNLISSENFHTETKGNQEQHQMRNTNPIVATSNYAREQVFTSKKAAGNFDSLQADKRRLVEIPFWECVTDGGQIPEDAWHKCTPLFLLISCNFSHLFMWMCRASNQAGGLDFDTGLYVDKGSSCLSPWSLSGSTAWMNVEMDRRTDYTQDPLYEVLIGKGEHVGVNDGLIRLVDDDTMYVTISEIVSGVYNDSSVTSLSGDQVPRPRELYGHRWEKTHEYDRSFWTENRFNTGVPGSGKRDEKCRKVMDLMTGLMNRDWKHAASELTFKRFSPAIGSQTFKDMKKRKLVGNVKCYGVCLEERVPPPLNT